MKTKAAVLVETGKPLEIAELELPALKPGQALVKIAYSGVCHTQLLEARGLRGPDKFLPHCLGHEGFGEIVDVAAGARWAKGMQVVLSWMQGDGANGGPVQYGWNGKTVNAGPIATFMTLAVISEDRISPLSDDRISPQVAALLGCAVPTGFGLIFNTLSAHQRHGVAVFGLGGIGLCAVAAAKLAGCSPIIAVDTRADRRAVAVRMGATHDVAGGPKAADAIKALAPRGLDLAVEATGKPEVMRQALAVVRPRGGCAAIAGNAPAGETLEIDPRELNAGKRLLGTWGGDNDPVRDFPKWARLIGERGIDLSDLTEAVYPLARVNDALDDLANGRAARPLIDPAA